MPKKYLELGDFKFHDKFPDLKEPEFWRALQMVNAQFSGVYSLWATMPPAERLAKRELCINYLIGWQLMLMNPDSVDDIGSVGGMPLDSKKIGPIALKYRDLVRQSGSGVLDMLTTNTFGLLALQMLQSAPENYLFYA